MKPIRRIVASALALLAIATNAHAICNPSLPPIVGIGNLGVQFQIPTDCTFAKVYAVGTGGNRACPSKACADGGGAAALRAILTNLTPGDTWTWTAAGFVRVSKGSGFSSPPAIVRLSAGGGGHGGEGINGGSGGRGGPGGMNTGANGEDGYVLDAVAGGGRGSTFLNGGSGGPYILPTLGNCVHGESGSGLAHQAVTQDEGDPGGKGGVGYYQGGQGAACIGQGTEFPPLGSGGGGGAASFIDGGWTDSISRASWDGMLHYSGQRFTDIGAPFFVQGYGDGATSGNGNTSLQGQGGRIWIKFGGPGNDDADITPEESPQLPLGGSWGDACEADLLPGILTDVELTNHPCQDDTMQCRPTLGGTGDRVCRYVCGSGLPATGVYVFRVEC